MKLKKSSSTDTNFRVRRSAFFETLGRPVVLSVDVDSFKRLKFKAETKPARTRDESRPQSEINDASEQEPLRTQSTAK